MEVEQVLHMNGGDGKTSYANNSAFQKEIICATKAIMKEAILDLYCTSFPEKLSVADLGCSSGPNTLSVVSDIVDAVEERCSQLDRRPPEFQLFLNDLPGNDFNTIFRSLPSFHREREQHSYYSRSTGDQVGQYCFVAGVPGSFYGRLFPSRSIHFIHSSSSLHWLSQVPRELQQKNNIEPLNKGNVCISKGSPLSVLNAYYMQFKSDFYNFLKMRSEEVVLGGCMVLICAGKTTADLSKEKNYLHWELLSRVLMDMVSKGLIEEEKVDSFNIPYYHPSLEEVKLEIEREGSFSLKCLKIFQVSWDASYNHNHNATENDFLQSNSTIGQNVASCMRAVLESMIVNHFGKDIIEDLFLRYSTAVDELRSKEEIKFSNLVISLVRKV